MITTRLSQHDARPAPPLARIAAQWWTAAAFALLPFLPPRGEVTPDRGIPVTVLRLWNLDNQRGWQAVQAGDLPQAEKAFRRAIEALRPYETVEPRMLARSYCDLARVLYEEHRYAEAEPLAKWALLVRETHPRVSEPARFQSVAVLAVIERGLKHYPEAEQLFRKSLAFQEKTLGPVHLEVSLTADALAGVLRDQGKYAESEKLYKRSLDILKRLFPDDHPEIALTNEHYAVLLRKMGRLSEAELLEAQVRASRAEAEASKRAQAEADARRGAGREKGARGVR